MRKKLFRFVAAVGFASVGTVLPAGPVAAQSVECDGVLVVVDATVLGGDVTVQCAQGAPGTGLDALTAAGFTFTFVPRIPGMVCQIDEAPSPCNNAPSDAYWSYWHQDPSGPWRYATEGAGTFRPAVGSIEGWVFGAGDEPPSFDREQHTTTPPANTQPPDATNGNDTATSDDDGDRANDTPHSTPTPSDTAGQSDGAGEDTEDQEIRSDGWPIPPRQLIGAALVIGGGVALALARRNNQKR